MDMDESCTWVADESWADEPCMGESWADESCMGESYGRRVGTRRRKDCTRQIASG